MSSTAQTASAVIGADDTIEDIFSRFPNKAQKLAHELTRQGLQCVGCSAATWETLRSGMLKHGKSEQDLLSLLSKLNTVILEEADLETISLTPRAAEKFRAIGASEGQPDAALRFGEQAAGCSGFEYTLEFAEAAPDEDEVKFESNGVSIYVHRQSLGRLLGSEIDYVDGLQSGFKISNPNVRSSCGCGSSHGYQ